MRFDFHRLTLPESDDFAYGGGGAGNEEIFGFSGFSRLGGESLANLADVALTLGPWRRLTLYAYYGRAHGREVFSRAFYRDRNADYFYVDLTFRY